MIARLAFCAPLALGSAVWAAEGDAPASQRVPAAGDARRVAVLPFGSVGKDAETNKLGEAVQQGLVSELSSTGALQASARSESVDGGAAEAAQKVRDSGAQYVVFGSVQSVNGQVRITGQAADVQSGRTIAPLKATGQANNFFAVQDDFARQAQAALYGQPAGGQAGYSAPRGPAMNAGSHWAGYEAMYEQARSAPPTVSYPPTPPPPPQGSPYGFGGLGACGGWSPFFGSNFIAGPFGGGFIDGGFGGLGNVGFVGGGLGAGRGFVPGQLGVSNAPLPPALTGGIQYRSAGSFLPQPTQPTQIPPYNRPIQDYRGPFYNFPSPVGLPQRVSPPNLRPGAPAPVSAPRPQG